MGSFGIACFPSFALGSQSEKDAKLKKIADKYSDIYGFPGIIVTVAREGKLIHSYAAGFRDLLRPNEITAKDQVAIGAISRVVCGYIAGQVVREKKLLEWDTDFESLCPDISATFASPANKASLQQFLTHTAGVTYATPNQDSVAKDPTPLAARLNLCKLSLSAKGVARPGISTTYASSSNLIVAMVEKAANKSYEELIAQYINQDLGLPSIRLGMEMFDERTSPVPRGHYLSKENREFKGYGQYSAWGANMRYLADANMAITGSPIEIARLMSMIAGYGGHDDASEIRKSAHLTPFPLSPYTQCGFSKSPLGLFHYGSTGLGEWASASILDATKTAVFTYMNCNYQEGGFKGIELVNELNSLFG